MDLPESDGDATSLPVVDQSDWSSDVAFLKDSGGLEEWRSFTATLTPSLDATQVQLPKLALADGGIGDKPTLTSGGIAEFEDGQAIPGSRPESPTHYHLFRPAFASLYRIPPRPASAP